MVDIEKAINLDGSWPLSKTGHLFYVKGNPFSGRDDAFYNFTTRTSLRFRSLKGRDPSKS